MVYIATVDALNHELSWISEPCHDLHSLFVNPVRHEVLSQCTVVTVGDLLLWACRGLFLRRSTPVIQVLHIDKVYITILSSIALIA